MVRLFRNKSGGDGVVTMNNKDVNDDDHQDDEEDPSSSKNDDNDNLTPEQEERRQKLGEGAYHLPGNTTWLQDWCQYFRNNHPLFAPCFQDRLHPISKGMRAVGLFGSLMVGLVITNVLFLWFIPKEEDDGSSSNSDEVAVFRLSTGGFAIKNGTSVTYYDEDGGSTTSGDDGGSTTGVSSAVAAALADQTTFEYSSTALILLWTIGSAIHALFDNTIWYATSCTCLNSLDALCCWCRRDDKTGGPVSRWVQNHRGWCNVLVIMLVVVMTAGATLVVMIRAMDESSEGNGGMTAQDVWNNSIESSTQGSVPTMPSGLEGAEPVTQKENYRFLMSYSTELIFAWFVWFPVVELILFSGILSCGGRIPGLGGRPAEIRAEEDEERKRNEQAAKKIHQAQKRLSSKTNNTNNKGGVSRPNGDGPPKKQRKSSSSTTKQSRTQPKQKRASRQKQ